jgi:outer membrane protein TolC
MAQISLVLTCALLALGCATRAERAAIAQRDDWVRTREQVAELPTLPAEPELADLERVALYSSPELQAAYARWRSEVAAIALARSLPDPTVGLGYFAQEVETRVGPQEAQFAFQQRIPWLSKLALAGDLRALAAQAAFAEAEAVRLDVRARVHALWGELYYLGQRISITEDNVELVRQWEQSARVRYQSAMLRYRDVTRAQIEQVTLDDELARLRDNRRPLVTQLLSLVGKVRNTDVPLPTALPENDPRPEDEELHALLQARNPELAASRHRLDRAEVEMDLARTRYWPDLSVGVVYTLTGDAPVAGVPDSGKDAVLPQLGVSLPIWWGAYRSGTSSAAAAQQAAAEGLRARRLGLHAELADALFRLRDAERRVALYRDEIIPKAQETLESTIASYRSGRLALIDLIDAQRTLFEFRLAAERARADEFITDARVRKLVGGA